MSDVEYEFVKGQGWVPRLKNKKFKLGDMVRLLENESGKIQDREYMRARYRDRYDRSHDNLPTFDEFRRDVRIERSFDRERYTLRYRHRAPYSRDTREYAIQYGRHDDIYQHLHLLYDQFIAAERDAERVRCERCGSEVNPAALRCEACGWGREPMQWHGDF